MSACRKNFARPRRSRVRLRSHEQDYRDLAERQGWQVAKVYVGEDISAYSGKVRSQYQQLLNDIAAKAITGVVAWARTDCIGRRPNSKPTSRWWRVGRLRRLHQPLRGACALQRLPHQRHDEYGRVFPQKQGSGGA
ncbi:recombinase family protein [Williamsia sp.]|uniref:recombinase family protein n=1 Tax=Williamsia sp. TaxID=1872085 RepID=UPI001A1C2155|nr:recombinase family protein [Williamsia sp.]